MLDIIAACAALLAIAFFGGAALIDQIKNFADKSKTENEHRRFHHFSVTDCWGE